MTEANNKPGRVPSCTDADGLKEALRPWATNVNFISYTHDRTVLCDDRYVDVTFALNKERQKKVLGSRNRPKTKLHRAPLF